MKTNLILGFFDGVHIAHRAVIASAVDLTRNNRTRPLLITLKDSPSLFFSGEKEYICERRCSYEIIKSLGVEEIIELDFEKVMTLKPEEYIRFLVENYSPLTISAGYNHTFGVNKTGSTKTLSDYQEKYGYEFICVPKQIIDGGIISSTLIKQYLKKGDIVEANKMLSGRFFIEGNVISGKQLGRTIGFPTANIKYPQGIIQVPYGVYKTELEINGTNYQGIMNWGIKPTVSDIPEPVAEVHILNFSGDLYGKTIRVYITDKIRGEMKFSGMEELKLQIEKDIDSCLKL